MTVISFENGTPCTGVYVYLRIISSVVQSFLNNSDKLKILTKNIFFNYHDDDFETL